jgi:hypothetical protein
LGGSLGASVSPNPDPDPRFEEPSLFRIVLALVRSLVKLFSFFSSLRGVRPPPGGPDDDMAVAKFESCWNLTIRHMCATKNGWNAVLKK